MVTKLTHIMASGTNMYAKNAEHTSGHNPLKAHFNLFYNFLEENNGTAVLF